MDQLKRKSVSRFITIILTFMFFGSIVLAQSKKPDNNLDTSRDYLINKLNRVVTSLAPADPARNGIILRLADLLSDRARQTTMLLGNGNCKACTPPDVDRKRALQYYNQALPKVAEANQAKVLVQVGHLNQLLGNQNAAIEVYSKITKESSDQVARAEAYLSVAEIYFKKSDWKQAQSNYEKSISTSNNDSKGYAMYRLGWADYNLGQTASAKDRFLTILKTPALLSKSGSNQNVTDVGFHEQVAKDYAIVSGASFNEADLKNIFEYSPEKKKLENLFAISSELERTAQKKEALVAWNFLYQNQPQPQDRAVVKAHMGTVHLQIGKNVAALEDFNEAYTLISENRSKFPNEAEDTRRLIKSSIITWNQAEKKKPTAELLEAYQGYLNNFGYEKEMSQWAVQIAAELKKWDVAWTIHSTATDKVFIAEGAPSKTGAEKLSSKSNSSNTSNIGNISNINNSEKTPASEAINSTELENHLLLGIELGESSKDSSILLQAQNEYIDKSKTKAKYWEVFYQKTYAEYEKAADERFLESLASILEAPAAPLDLRVKAGDLHLDYLASKKRDSEIEIQARTFHKTMASVKGYQSDWAKIAEKSILTQVANLVQDGKLDLAWEKIQAFQVKNADSKDVVIFYKNKVIIAEKRNDITSALRAAKEMNTISTLEKDDKTFAQAKMAYFSDLKMDFRAALALTEQLPESIISADKKNLKLAMYSDLLGQSSTAFLKKFVETSKDQTSKEVAIMEIVKKSSNMDDEIKKQEKAIPTSYNILGELAAMSYAAKGEKSYGFQMVEKNSEVKKTPQGILIMNGQKLKALGAFGDNIQKMTLDSDIAKKDFQKKLTKDIQARSQAFLKLDELASDAIKTKDWTLQVVSLSLIARESERFYTEILSLPMPEQLTPEEQGEYMRLLGEKAQPYKSKAEMAKTKLNEFWGDATWQASLNSKLSGTLAVLAQNEKTELLKIADDKNKLLIAQLTGQNLIAEESKKNESKESTKVSTAEVETAKTEVKNEPFSLSKIQTLKDMETKNGNIAMVQYLEGRINDLNVGDRKIDTKGVQK